MIAPRSKKAFQQLVEKYQDGKATPEETAFIEKYYQFFDKEATATASMTPEEKNELENSLLQKIRAAAEKDRNKVVPLYGRTIFRVAAAAILLFVVVGLWFVVGRRGNNRPDIVQVPAVQDAAPGRNGAVLTLADGKVIVLDSLTNGIVAKQNGSDVTLDNGRLQYATTHSPLTTPTASGQADHSLAYNTLSTPRGRQFQLTLPDGSRVWLNAASSITYPVAFNEKQRKVKIVGEAYFEVSPLPTSPGGGGVGSSRITLGKIPFIVDVDGKQTIEVLGTHFNINSYADEDAIRTTLLEGKIKVVSTVGLAQGREQSAVLKPGEQAIHSRLTIDDSRFTIDYSPDITYVMAWKNGLFQFDYTPIDAVLRQLSRWYDVDVVYEKNVPDIKLVGEIGRDLTLTQALRGLGKMGVQYRIEGKKLIIMQDK